MICVFYYMTGAPEGSPKVVLRLVIGLENLIIFPYSYYFAIV